MAPVVTGRKGEFTKLIADLQKEGFSRVRVDGEIVKLTRRARGPEQEDQALHRRGGGPRHLEGHRRAAASPRRWSWPRAWPTGACWCRCSTRRATRAARRAEPPAGPRAAWARGSTCSRWRWRARSTATPSTSCSRATSAFNAPYGACPDCLGIGIARGGGSLTLVVPDPSLYVGRRGHRRPSRPATTIPRCCGAVARHMGSDDRRALGGYARPRRSSAIMHGLGNQKVRVDYVTVDGRETYWYIEWEGVLEAVRAHATHEAPDRTLHGRSWPSYFATIPCADVPGQAPPEARDPGRHRRRQVHLRGDPALRRRQPGLLPRLDASPAPTRP